MAVFGHTAEACITCRADYNGEPPCEKSGICERFTKMKLDDETFPTRELPGVRTIIHYWRLITAASTYETLKRQEKRGDKIYEVSIFLPTLSALPVWAEVIPYNEIGIDKRTFLYWLGLFHSEYVAQLRAKHGQ